MTSHILAHASAPALTNFPDLPPSSHSTAFTPPGPASLIAMFFIGFATLQTYTFVSSDPEAQCLESAVQESELILAEWKAHREVIVLVEKKRDE